MGRKGQTDAMKLIVVFRSFLKAPNKSNNVQEKTTLADHNICLCFVKELINN